SRCSAGCEYEGRLYAQGEVRYSGPCEQQCRCGSDGTFICGPLTCPTGLFPAGQHANQDLCIELRNRPGTDECCVVVACANSLAKPSVLTSPTLALPSPSQVQEPLGGHEVWALTGRAVSHDKPLPITDKQYQQQQLKDLEEELNKNGDKKKATEDKLKDKSKPSEVTAGVELDNTTDTTNITQEEMFDIEPVTTLAPLRSPEDIEDTQAVVVEYDDGGEPVHRITLQEQVDVVTESITPMEEEMVTKMEEEEMMMVTEETATEPNTTTMMPDLDLNLAREGKQVPDDDNSTHQVQPATEPSNSKVEGKAGVGALKVRGELYYKSLESTEWLQEEVATGQDSVVLRGLVPNTQYTLKWSGNFGGSAKVTIDTEDGCRTDNNHSYGLSEEWSEGCQQRCSCRPGGRVDCQPRCIFVAGDIQDPQCTEKPAQDDPECCVAYDCSSVGESEVFSPNTQDVSGLPKLLVTAKTHNSVTLAWDDFRARTYEGGYVAEYREEGVGSRLSQEPWKREEVPAGEQPPKITVETLKPNTLYEVRVSIYDDVEEGRLGESTETINFRTDAGCEHSNSSHAVGEFFNGCEERCMCLATGAVRCFERCTLPYIRTGSFKGDPFCSEKQNETDECCAIVHCTSSKREYTPCTNVVCGPNAKCISSAPTTGEHSLIVIESDLTPGYCRCNDGFIGDASDLITGCIPDPSAGQRESNCTFKNSTYRPGDVFYDECDYRCSCNNNTEIECEPRCEFPHKDGSEPEPGCEYLPDPDDECCKLRVCNSSSAAATDAARAPSLPSDGCTKGNVTYARNEKFYNGCETQCICMGFGDVSCFPRCPPLKVVSESPKRCETLPDPLDPCCSITVCDKETPDVMKANITELEDEMMKNMTDEEKELIKKQMMNLTDTEKAMMIKGIMNISEAQEDSMMNVTLTEMPDNSTMMMMEHTHEDGTTHNIHLHTHEDGTTHSHPHDGPHTHDEHTHTHEDGTTHTHPHDDTAHTHNETDMMFTHTHEDGTTHSHPHDGPHTHNETDMFLHTHEDGTTHSHPHDGPHTHNETDMFLHTHEDGTTHSHPHDGPHTHNDEDMMNATDIHLHTHEDGTTHSHPHDGPHTHDEHTHTHEDGTNHSHTHNEHTHTHEDGTTHTHPHDGPHTHDDEKMVNETHIHLHTHEDGTTHTHPHEDHTHTHEDGTTHTHSHNENMDDLHNHEHTHDDGTTHNHSHDHNMPNSHDHDHNHTHEHTHEDGTTHSHSHDHTFTNNHDHDHNMTENGHNTTDEMDHQHDIQFEKKNRAEDLGSHDLHILEVSPLNTTTVMITIAVSDAVMQQIQSSEEQHFTVLYSPDSLTWSERKIPVSDIKVENFTKVVVYVSDLQPSTPYQFRVAFQEFVSSTSKARLMDGTIDRDGREPVDIDTSTMCFNNGSYYKPGEEFYEGCSNSCICTESLEVHCASIECPVTFGLELIDPDCFEWDVDPDYIPTPPKCCPQMKCMKTYACQYMGQTFNNYDEVPREMTGCSQVCTCNYGNVTCRPLCGEVPPIPPPHLNCAPESAILVTLPGEPCCRSWQCPSHSVGNEIPEPHISSLDAETLHLVFSTPSLYEGLPGKLVIRYTNESSLYPDPNTWYEEVVLPESSLISQTKWEHIITGLQPATQYTIQIVLTIHGAEPKLSPIVSYTTMTQATTPSTTTPLPRLDIDAELYASAITKTSAKVSWRGFNEFELQYIDGVQVKYTEKDKLIPRFSQLFHRDNNQMDVRDLQPGHTYTVDLVFISHPNQTTQVSSTRPITFSTLPEEDLYAFEIQVQAGKVSSQTAELFYSGVPEPEEKFVNVYRVVYLREDERVDAQAFKIPKTGQDRKIFLENLKPDVEYKVWIEAFLSNGRKKQSNVITITTRAGQLPKPERSEVDPSARDTEGGEDYYPAMVAVAIIAAIACAAFLGLLVILLRRNKSQRKANINSGNNAAYDNPSYKVGDNTYDMEMNGIKSSGNGATYAEDP
ncbi:hypothetical protein Pcinc_015624, partial [Petrolisthes cinctipes]